MSTPTRAELDIRRRVAASGPVPFSDFMALALYHPEDGYYTRPDAATGAKGDFATSPDVSPAFGRRLAVQAIDVWDRLGGGPWSLVELGPGRGLLAADILEGLAEFEPRARAALTGMTLVEISPSLAQEQRARLGRAAPGLDARWVRDLRELPAQSVRGVVIGNEVLDALPVHVVARRGAELVERCVGLGERSLVWCDQPPSDPRLAERVAQYGLCRRDGDQAEVCLELEPFLRQIARVLDRGAVVFVDYGHTAARLGDEEHADGTLLGYYRHRVEPDVLARPGLQDITAHVNWSHLEDAAREAGLAPAGRVAQDRFLLALGIVDDLVPAGDPADETPEALARRLAARSLILPGPGGGQRFEAVALVRQIPPDLRGLRDPFASLP